MPSIQDVQTWRGRDLHGPDGKIGEVADIYLDRQTEEPEWLAVKAGLFGSKVHFVPIREASASGDEVKVPYDKDKVKGAPNVDADGELSPDEERKLYEHYGQEYGDPDGHDHEHAHHGEAGHVHAEGDEIAHGEAGHVHAEGDEEHGRGTVGHDTSGRTTDDAMTRSEEELRVGKRTRETGRARLRKFIVEEEVHQTVPVQREEVHVDREPITEHNRDAAHSGPELSEEEHEVTLHAEEAVADKHVVAKERVRLDTDVVTEQQEVNETVRGERIEVEGDVHGQHRG